MAHGDALPANSSAARIAKKADALPGRPDPPTQAFQLRKARREQDKDEQDLSVGWLEYFADLDNAEHHLYCTLHCMARNYEPDKRSRVLILDVDRARSLLASRDEFSVVHVVHTPIKNDPVLKDNPSHASVVGIAGLTEDLQLLAAQQLALSVKAGANHEWRELQNRGIAPRPDH